MLEQWTEGLMLSIQDQVSRATQAGMASQLEIHAAFAGKVMDSMQQVVGLNLNLAWATFEQSNFAARQLISAEDPQEFFSLAAAQIRPNATRTLDYGYYLTTIAADAQAGVIKTVSGGIAESNRELIALAEDVREISPFDFKATLANLRSVLDSIAYLYAEIVRMTQKSFHSLNSTCDVPSKRIAYAGGRARRTAYK